MATIDIIAVPVCESSLQDVKAADKKSRKRKRTESKLPPSLFAMSELSQRKMEFDASKHLNYAPPAKIWSMKEIGLEDKGVSHNAVSEPFPLFTPEAIEHVRAEILSERVFENCQYSSNLAHCQLRGYAPKYAPFVYKAWHSPEVLSIVSKIAGIDLVPQMDFEIAHVNISITTPEQAEADRKVLEEKAHRDADEGVSGCPWEDDEPIVDWHTDSYPFVCVTMLSDCANMVGGETALRTGNGDIMKVRGPAMGHAVVLQGRYIEHRALRTLGGSERITMVTSFRPRSAFVKDDTVLTTVRSISILPELYFQYSEYRLEMLEERFRSHLKDIRARKKARQQFSTATTKAFIEEQKCFLESMLKEMVDDDKVIAGFTDESHLVSDELIVQAQRKSRSYSQDLS